MRSSVDLEVVGLCITGFISSLVSCGEEECGVMSMSGSVYGWFTDEEWEELQDVAGCSSLQYQRYVNHVKRQR